MQKTCEHNRVEIRNWWHTTILEYTLGTWQSTPYIAKYQKEISFTHGLDFNPEPKLVAFMVGKQMVEGASLMKCIAIQSSPPDRDVNKIQTMVDKCVIEYIGDLEDEKLVINGIEQNTRDTIFDRMFNMRKTCIKYFWFDICLLAIATRRNIRVLCSSYIGMGYIIERCVTGMKYKREYTINIHEIEKGQCTLRVPVPG